MDAQTFLKSITVAEAERVALKAGTKLVYLRQIASGFRHPSRDLALRLQKASGGRMSAAALLGVAA